MQIDFTGKAYLVTGGASGIGEAAVRYIAEHGGQAVIADINDEAGEALASRFPDQLTLPNFSLGIVPRVFDGLGEMQQVVVFGAKFATDLFLNRFTHRMRVLKAFKVDRCIYPPCTSPTHFQSNYLLVCISGCRNPSSTLNTGTISVSTFFAALS